MLACCIKTSYYFSKPETNKKKQGCFRFTKIITSKSRNKNFKKLSLLNLTLRSVTIIINQVENQDDRVRTCDPLCPKQVLYQTELHPETLHILSLQ